MKLTIKELREMIKNILGSDPSEAYDKLLVDDPALKKPSVYVPNKAKKRIKAYLRKMMPTK